MTNRLGSFQDLYEYLYQHRPKEAWNRLAPLSTFVLLLLRTPLPWLVVASSLASAQHRRPSLPTALPAARPRAPRPLAALAWRSYDAEPSPVACRSRVNPPRDAMEKKRKLPARTSARVENANKRRNLTPRADRSVTPPPPPEPVVKEPSPTPPPPLPTSLQPGQPLPTIESAQPDDLSAKEYQSISERHVLP